MTILGLSFFYHDAAASLVQNGVVLGAAQEERFSRRKHDSRFPSNAISNLLNEARLTMKDIDIIAYYEDPRLKLNRLIHSYSSFFPPNFSSLCKVVESQLGGKLSIQQTIRKETGFEGTIRIVPHHVSHAASAFFPSPFEKAAFLTLDGVGEWNTTTFGVGEKNKLTFHKEINFPHSLGLLYSAFTYFTGFKVNSGEYKMMGLAPYGEPKYATTITNNLINVKEDGSFALNMEYFNYTTGEQMISRKFATLFGRERREPESPLTQDDMDIARSIQEVLEDVVLRMGTHIKRETKEKNLCMAGGVALNCVVNGRLSRSHIFDNIFIQPASGDAGGSLGAALYEWYHHQENNRESKDISIFFNPYLGPEYSEEDIRTFLDSNYIPYKRYDAIEEKTAKLIADGHIVGWFQGRMEYGPRALGNRSILGHPGLPDMQKKMNVKIKFRESFRPFAPAILEEDASNWFQESNESPYMLTVHYLKEERRKKVRSDVQGLDRLKFPNSEVPAISHVDFSARVQTVRSDQNHRFYTLIKYFKKLTGIPIIVNTSFNVRGEPIVCSPEDAFRCFMRTAMDYLIIGNFMIRKNDQRMKTEVNWQMEYELD